MRKRGDALYKSKKYEEARKAYTAALRETSSPSLLLSRAACDLMLAHTARTDDEARQAYERAQSDCEACEGARALLRLGACKLGLGDPQAARQHCLAAMTDHERDASRVLAACDAVEEAMKELRVLTKQFLIDTTSLAPVAKKARTLSRLLPLGQVAEASIAFERRQFETAIALLDEAIAGKGVSVGGGGHGAPPGGAPPHRSALYALRARALLCAAAVAPPNLLSKLAHAARDDVSRAAAAVGASTDFGAVQRLCNVDDAAFLVRLKARCDLLSARVALARRLHDRNKLLVNVATAIATLEAGGSAKRQPKVPEFAEIDVEIHLLDGLTKLTEDPDVVLQPSSTFAAYDEAYVRFEARLADAADASVPLADLPLPPDDARVSGATPGMPPEDLKLAIRLALLRWHPDKAQANASKFVPADRDALIATAAAITRRIILERRELLC